MRFIYQARLPDPRDVPAPVHDGDTIKLELDRGFGDQSVVTLRLRNTFAPELAQPGGVVCRTFTRRWLEDGDSYGWPYLVETVKTRGGIEVQTFARYVAEVTLADEPDASLNLAVSNFVRANGWGGGIGSPADAT